MADTILVTGGTGVLGGAVTRRLLDDGARVRVLSRRTRRPETVPDRVEWVVGDLATGAGLPEALDGVTAVVHCASDSRHWKSDIAAARRLFDVARTTGSPHLVYVSIAGVDRVPYGYYRAKLEVERLLEASGLPWTVLRATQFHDLVLTVAQWLARLPVVLVPAGVRTQPVDVAEVANRLADLARNAPAGRVPDLGGPEALTAADAVRALLRATGRRRTVVSVPLPGKTMRAVRRGGLLAPGQPVGGSFADFLRHAPLGDRRYGAAQRSVR
ncbi:NAD(P)H-binding protein [Streptomyces sp. ICBB 8177]|uniref:SDR family oxidoreductase n=1 Tax=Streptomyces sp. ICBB 8177 TaxID=563922 RepID=UPI000D678387|nr:NAD(P)H-binding protein [Streptomyces sp. ICBB 8177]PWI45192.1 NmrA family transcriptional regulator [Streptomyces sp. ICBB 8177]